MDRLSRNLNLALRIFALLVIVCDVLITFHQSKALYNHYYHPHWLLGTPVSVQKFQAPQGLQLSSAFIRLSNPQAQAMRYIELLTHKPTLFSVVRQEALSQDPFIRAWKGQRWDSLLVLREYFERMHDNSLSAEEIKTSYGAGRSWIHSDIQSLNIEWRQYQPHNFEFNVWLKQTDILYNNDSYTRHWHVEVDGKPAPLLQKKGRMKAIQLTPGSHHIHFYYAPNNYYYALILFYLAFLISLKGASLHSSLKDSGHVMPTFQA